ncbi:hypothetical protein DNTS_029963 [Danionella cerebrum]|uniref:SMP-30/Gluconolactonase/LRE-like region domain-containing protein n=1 Tax=Danionella cerebrum TaxID=2873325 RepID=A0A553PXR3_9TELE|nr:hypothetical protein DNTS_029963 [Danionella translucida]
MSSIRVECVIKERNAIGESPVWEERDSSLLYVDITGRKICRWSSLTKTTETISTGTRFAFVDWAKRSITNVAEVKEKPNTRFNDGKVDPAGRFVAGTMSMEMKPDVVDGALYTLHPDHSVVRQLDRVHLSNGLDWSLDHQILYYIDSLAYMPNAGWFIRWRKKKGSLMACALTQKANCTRMQTVKLPAENITSCCFGGKDYSDLYITSASIGLDSDALAKQPEAGCIFKVTSLGVKGIAPYSYTG